MSASASSSNRFPELEKYELLEEVGHGGMATVYRARDARLERDVAVKVIHKHLRENPEVRRRFTSEAKAVAKLRHPSIVDVYDVSDDEDIERYLVVELIRGSSLREFLQEHGSFPAEIAAIIVAILCDAVGHAHVSGVIHRDIKPENVLVELPPPASQESLDTDPGHSSERTSRRRVIVKLTDFGIAKVLDAQGVTSTGQILGSPAHMAPEQIEGGEIGPATDVFALGVLFYECMVGHLPFEGTNPAQVLRRVLDGLYEPAETEEPSVGGHWSSIVDATLRLAPEDRVESAEAFRAMIDDELASLGITDQAGELVEFFTDPEAYRSAHAERLVPVLLDRGEAAKKEGQVPEAAADFNRALALRPDDLTILKRVTSLTNQRVWRERVQRIGALLLGSVALGGIAFGVTRLVSSEPEGAVIAAVPPSIPSVAPAPSVYASTEPEATASSDDGDTAPAPSSADDDGAAPTKVTTGPSVRPTATVAASSDGPDEEPSGVASVRIHINPGAAKLTIDGTPTEWFGTKSLSVGPHALRAWVEGDVCTTVTTSIQVKEPDDPTDVQRFTLNLECKPARFTLTGAPTGATVACRGAVAQAGGAGVLPMGNQSATPVRCQFSEPGGTTTTSSVTLKAGKTTPIAWPR